MVDRFEWSEVIVVGSTRGWASDGPRSRQITIHLSEAERESVGEVAWRLGMRPGAWVAEVAVGHARGVMDQVPPSWRELLQEMLRFRAEVQRTGQVINQVAKHAYATGEFVEGTDQLLAVSERLLQRVDAAVDEAGRRV